MISRRGFLGGLLATSALVAVSPAAAHRLVYDKARRTIVEVPILWGDGKHDDTAAIQAMIDGKPYHWQGETLRQTGNGLTLPPGDFKVQGVLSLKYSYVTGSGVKLTRIEHF